MIKGYRPNYMYVKAVKPLPKWARKVTTKEIVINR